MSGPTLYIVATPLGNLQDFSPRARQTLADVPLILAEDTRRARQLLNAFEIQQKELVSYYDETERQKAAQIVMRMQRDGIDAALISDAGTPGIADPGFHLTRAAHEAGINVSPIPGPSATVALACAAGLPTDRMLFVGFLPTKASALEKEFRSWSTIGATVLCFSPARRLQKVLEAMEHVFPEACIAVGRELTKLHEQVVRGSVTQVKGMLGEHIPLLGEVVLMVEPGTEAKVEETDADGRDARAKLIDEAKQAFLAGDTIKDLLRRFKHSGMSRSELYQLLLEVKENVN